MTDNYVCVDYDSDSPCQCDSCMYRDTFESDNSPCDNCIYVHDVSDD